MPYYEPMNLSDRLYDYHSSDDGLFKYWVGAYPMASLFRYRGLLRKLILDFKIKGRWQSGMALVDIFAADEFVQYWAHEADYIMAVPSSFWGRWRGKHDLAFALAERLSSNTGVPILSAPRRSFFRFEKQSFLSLNERLGRDNNRKAMHEESGILELRNGKNHDTKSADSDRPLIVLVDDIVTSAKTLKTLAHTMPLARYRFLTLATAYRARPWEDDL
ncbi:MAG: hypothetical protein V4655_13435 [Bdellovibrionota bacterium]